jgi:hypothetical protein
MEIGEHVAREIELLEPAQEADGGGQLRELVGVEIESLEAAQLLDAGIGKLL